MIRVYAMEFKYIGIKENFKEYLATARKLLRGPRVHIFAR